jgi:hypothetical protein
MLRVYIVKIFTKTFFTVTSVVIKLKKVFSAKFIMALVVFLASPILEYLTYNSQV